MSIRPAAEMLLDVIERLGFVSAHDLYSLTGIRPSGQDSALSPDIAKGVISVEADPVRRRGKIGRAYRWHGKPQAEEEARIRDRARRPAKRRCLSCGNQFQSASAANRICPDCKIANDRRSGCGRFGESVTAHYR